MYRFCHHLKLRPPGYPAAGVFIGIEAIHVSAAKARPTVPRLKRVAPRLKSVKSRLATSHTPATEVDRSRQRDRDAPWRRNYKTARWQKLRLKIIERDRYTCQQTGVLLVGRHPAANSPVVDHIRPHRGDDALFWDESNLQCVAKSWHDTTKQSRERRGLV